MHRCPLADASGRGRTARVRSRHADAERRACTSPRPASDRDDRRAALRTWARRRIHAERSHLGVPPRAQRVCQARSGALNGACRSSATPSCLTWRSVRRVVHQAERLHRRGSQTTSAPPFHQLTLAERWNGRAWEIQPTPNATGAPDNSMDGVCAERAAPARRSDTRSRTAFPSPSSRRWPNGGTAAHGRSRRRPTPPARRTPTCTASHARRGALAPRSGPRPPPSKRRSPRAGAAQHGRSSPPPTRRRARERIRARCSPSHARRGAPAPRSGTPPQPPRRPRSPSALMAPPGRSSRLRLSQRSRSWRACRARPSAPAWPSGLRLPLHRRDAGRELVAVAASLRGPTRTDSFPRPVRYPARSASWKSGSSPNSRCSRLRNSL